MQIIEDWASDKSILAAEQFCLHLQERFDAGSIRVVTVENHGDFLSLLLTANCWEGQGEFALQADGDFN